MKFYKLINSSGYVLSNHYEKSAEMVLGYGGVWTKDHRKAKRFSSMKDCQREVNRMYGNSNYLVVSNTENWKEIFNRYKLEGKL